MPHSAEAGGAGPPQLGSAATGYAAAFSRSLGACIECARDPNEEVRQRIEQSLLSMAKKDFGMVLDTTARYLLENRGTGKTPQHQRVSLLRALKLVALEYDEHISDKLLHDLIVVAVQDMTAEIDINSPWQLAASELAVDLCCIGPAVAIPYVTEQIPGTSLPHFFVLRTLGEAAARRPLRFLPHLKTCMARVLPILATAKQDNMRFAFAEALASFADAVSQLQTLPELSPRASGSAQFQTTDFADSIYTAMSLLLSEWANARELRVRTTVVMAIGKMAGVVTAERLEEKLVALVKVILEGAKREKPKDTLSPLRGLTFFVRACMEKAPTATQTHLENLWQSVFKHATTFHSLKQTEQAELIKCHQEQLLSMEAMAGGQPDVVLNYIQKTLDAKVGSKDPNAKIAALGTLQHLVMQPSLHERFEPFKNHVVAIVRTCLEDPDYRVQQAVVRTIMSMGSAEANNYLACEGGESLVEHVVVQAAKPLHVIEEWQAKNKKAVEAGAPGPKELAALSRSVFNLMFTTRPNLDLVLWPFVLEVFGMAQRRPELVNIFVQLCSCIVEVGKRLGNTTEFYFDFEKKVNVPRPEALVATFLPLVAQTGTLGKQNMIIVLNAMETLAPLLDEPMKRSHDGTTPVGSLWLAQIPQLREYVESEEFAQDDYESACYLLFKKSVTVKKEEQWKQQVAAAMAAQCPQWCPANFPADHLKDRQSIKRVALNMLGLAISRVNMKTFVTEYIDKLVEETDHSSEQQRIGCSSGFGYISINHTDAVLEKLNRVAKPPKQQGGGMFSKKQEQGVDRDYGEGSRATVLLSFGQVAKQAAASDLFTSRLETHVVPTVLELLQNCKGIVVKEAAFAGIQLLSTSLRSVYEFNFVSKASLIQAVSIPMLIDAPSSVDPTSFNLLLEGVRALIPTVYLLPVCDPDLCGRLKQVSASGFSKLFNTVTDLRAKPENIVEDKKDKGTASIAGPPLPESVLVKQLGLLVCAIIESAPEMVPAMIDQGHHIAPFLRSAQLHERERSMQAFVAAIKHFGKQLDKRGEELPLLVKGPVELGGGEMPGAVVKAEKAPEPAKRSLSFGSKKEKEEKRNSLKGAKPDPVVPEEFSLGIIFARLVPRLADTSLRVRQQALDGLVISLKLYLLRNGESEGIMRAIEVVKGVNGRLDYEDETAMVAVMREIGGSLCGFLGEGGKELPMMIDELIVKGLIDPVIDSAVAVCALLAQLFKNLGGAVEEGETPPLTDEEVQLFAAKLIAALGAVTGPDGLPIAGREDAHRGILLATKACSKNRPTLVFNHLLTYPVPHPNNLVKGIQTLANDAGLSRLITNHCLDVLLNAQLFEEGYSSGSKLTLCQPVIAAVCTLGEVFETTKGAEVAKALQAPLFCALVLLLASAHEAPRVHEKVTKEGGPPPAELVCGAIKSFVHAVYSHSLNDRAEKGVWEQLKSSSGFPAGCAQLVTFVVHDMHEEGDKEKMPDDEGEIDLPPTTSCPIVEELYDFMRHYVQKIYDCHRWCAMTVLGQLLYHCKGNDTLLQGMVNDLLSRAGADEKVPIKLQAVRGYGHLPVHEYEAIRVYVTPVIASLNQCCADPHVDVCLISLGTLEQFVQRIGCKTELSAVVVSICNRTKVCLDLTEAPMRAAGCSLFGTMVKLSAEGLIDYKVMENAVFGHLAGLLVHVNDGDPQVRFSCKTALHEVVGWLNSDPPTKKAREHLERLFKKEHVAPAKATNYDEFANDFAKIWVRHYEDRMNDLLVALAGYFQSPWSTVRAAAAILCGTILRHLSSADQARSNLESTCAGLMGLLRKDGDSLVRLKAARALGMLGDMK
eukprot:Hpha_TRINITY_DN15256_c5_g1::TRINITY_DN15256_c5_g1_i1::g.65105::m.65105